MRKSATNVVTMLLVLVGCMGCGNRPASSADNLVRVDVIANYLEEGLIPQDLMDMEYITLETTDDFITKDAVKAIGRGTILVMNRDGDGDILVSDRNGKGLRKINHLGQNGEEYTQLTGFVLDKNNDEIFVKGNPTRKIGVYDLLGNYKRSLKSADTGYYSHTFNYDRDHSIYYKSYPLEKGKRGCHLIISKQDGRITHEIQIPSKGVETPVMTEEELVITLEFYLTFLDRGKWIFVNIPSDIIFHYLPDGNLSPFIARSPPIPSMNTKVFLFPTITTDRYCSMKTMREEVDFTTLKGFLGEDLVYDRQENALLSHIPYNNGFINKEEVSLASEPRNPEVTICQILDAPDLVEIHGKGQPKGKLREITTNLDEESNPVAILLKKKK